MIKTFKCKETEGIFNLVRSRKLPADIQPVALRKLRMLNRSSKPMNPTDKLHPIHPGEVLLEEFLKPMKIS